MAAAPPPADLAEPVRGGEEGMRDNQVTERVNRVQVVPEDGYLWRKYGQKFIRNIRKNRSYFKCQRATCRAKKKVEWPNTDPNDLRVVYEGSHNHESPIPLTTSQQEGSTSGTNRYNLYSQVFGANDP